MRSSFGFCVLIAIDGAMDELRLRKLQRILLPSFDAVVAGAQCKIRVLALATNNSAC